MVTEIEQLKARIAELERENQALRDSRRQGGRPEAITKVKMEVVEYYFQLKAQHSRKSNTKISKMIAAEIYCKKEFKIGYKTILKFLRRTYKIDGHK